MRNGKLRVGLLFGGRSAEHEVSLQSAKNIIAVIDQGKYELLLIGIDRDGRWFKADPNVPILDADNPKKICLNASATPVGLIIGKKCVQIIDLSTNSPIEEIDVLFPVLHGPWGEDGSIQGVAKQANLPCVGSGILGSAVCMDKDVSKRMLREGGIPVVEFVTLRRKSTLDTDTGNAIIQSLGLPVFVKPANFGSSIGISRADSIQDLIDAVHLAREYDTKVLIEKAINGREIECAVLGNDNPIASIPGEIIPHDSFYTYKSKYIDKNGATLQIPANLSGEIRARIQETAIQAFQLLECRGMARIDMFLTPDCGIYVNEVNTIPGFTSTSMYPKLWEVSGLSRRELLDQIIQLAIEDFRKIGT